MSLFDDIRKALQGKNKNEFIDQILKEQAFYDALHKAGLTVTAADPTERGRLQPFGVLSKVQKIDLIDLISIIELIKVIQEIIKIDEITVIKTIEAILSLPDITVKGSEGIAVKQATGAAGTWVSPDGFSDPDVFWLYEAYAYDTLTNTGPWCEIPATSWSSFLYLTLSSGIQCNKLKAYLSKTYLPGFNPIDIDVYRDGGWVHVFEGNFGINGWNEFSFGQGLVTQMRIRGYNPNAGSSIPNCLKEVYFWQVPTTGGELMVCLYAWDGSSWKKVRCDADGYLLTKAG